MSATCCIGGCIVQCFDVCVRTVYNCIGLFLCAVGSILAFMAAVYVYVHYIAPDSVIDPKTTTLRPTTVTRVAEIITELPSVTTTTTTTVPQLSALNDLDVNCGVKYNITKRSYVSDCVFGYLLNFGNNTIYFNGKVLCECKKCTRHWTDLTNVCRDNGIPRRHGIGCRFGGPKRGYNCWRNNPDVEVEWTTLEKELAMLLENPMVEIPLRWRFVTRFRTTDFSFAFQVAHDWDVLYLEPLISDQYSRRDLSGVNSYLTALFELNRLVLEN